MYKSITISVQWLAFIASHYLELETNTTLNLKLILV